MSVRVGDDIVAGGQGDMYTKAQVDALIANAIAQTTEKPGMIKPFAGTTIPTGYLLCDGSAVSRTTYADLFTAIGTTYGSGDGSTTFNLPDLLERVPRMSSTGTGAKNAGWAPNIKGMMYIGAESIFVSDNGCFYLGNNPWRGSVSGSHNNEVCFSAARCWNGYSDNVDSIMARNLIIGGYVIKY